MKRNVVLSDKAARPIGPYSQAIHAEGSFIFTSGQIPLDAEGKPSGESIEDQTHAVFANLKAILEKAGSSLEAVVKTTVFLKDMNDFAAMNAVYKTYFDGPTPPARSTIEVARLPLDARVEIEATALVAN